MLAAVKRSYCHHLSFQPAPPLFYPVIPSVRVKRGQARDPHASGTARNRGTHPAQDSTVRSQQQGYIQCWVFSFDWSVRDRSVHFIAEARPRCTVLRPTASFICLDKRSARTNSSKSNYLNVLNTSAQWRRKFH